MSRLREITQRKDERKARLHSALCSIIKQLAELGALKIVLFGSVASDDVDVNSDLDLLAIMPPLRSGREWSELVYEKVERGVASDIIVYNEKEYEKELPVSSFLRQATRTGRVVYEKTVQG